MSIAGIDLLAVAIARLRRLPWQLAHHILAHPLIGISGGGLWAWQFHDWTGDHAWPGQGNPGPEGRWRGLE